MKKIVPLTKKLISIPSVSGDSEKTNEIVELVKKTLSGYAFKMYSCNDIPSLLYRNTAETKNFKIILNAHLDVVPGKTQQFEPNERNGRIYGRGAYDMKAAAAVMILLFKEIAADVSYPLGLQLITDEELANSKGTTYQLEQGIKTDFAIIGECGSNLNIINENKNTVAAEITTSGIVSHGAYPWKGKNAILRMNEVIKILQKHFPVPTAETFATTVNITQITASNKTWNTTPDDCTITLDIRFPKEESTTALNLITSLLPKDVTFKVLQKRTHYETNPQNKYIAALKKAGAAITGQQLHVTKTFGGSDAIFFHKKGYNAIEFGPVGAGQHDSDEWVDIKKLEDYYLILKSFLLATASI
jgi:succinyl-diaminopimelate desuccinylase